MSQKPSTNNKDEQKAPSPGAETEIQAENRALKARLAELEAAAAAAAATAATSEAKSSAESAPKHVAEPGMKPASSSTPATLAINESGYDESGQYPPPDPKLHPPQQRERLQKSAPRPPQPKKPSTQGRVEQPAAKEREKKVKEQKELGNTERRASLGGYEVTSGAEGLAGSKHVPGKTAHRQPPQPRGQGRGKRGGGQARGGAVVKKEEGEMRGHQIRGASQRGRAGMLPPSRPPPRQTSIPAPSPPQQQPCHMPYCQGNFGPGVRFCPLCGVSRQEPAASSYRQQPCHMPYCWGNFGPGVRFCPLCGASRQEPQVHGTYGAPYQERRDSSTLFQYVDSRLGAHGSPPQYASSPAPAVHLTINNAPSQPSSAPLEPFLTRGSTTPAPPATNPSRPLKRERSPSSSLQTEATISRGAKRRRRLAEEKAAARAASTVLPSIETLQPPSVAEVPQQLLGRQSESSGDRPVEQPIKSEPDSSDEMEFAPASSDAGLIKKEPL